MDTPFFLFCKIEVTALAHPCDTTTHGKHLPCIPLRALDCVLALLGGDVNPNIATWDLHSIGVCLEILLGLRQPRGHRNHLRRGRVKNNAG
jgi:hypothetical protein